MTSFYPLRPLGLVAVASLMLVIGGCSTAPTIITKETDKFIHVCVPQVDYTAVQNEKFALDLGPVDPNSSVISRLRDYQNMRRANQKCILGGGSIGVGNN